MDSYINMLNTVLYIINNESIFRNKKLCVIFFEVNPANNFSQPISDACFIYQNYSADEIFNKIKWTNFAFNNNLNDIVIVIKIL